jgi:UDP-2-acetamido-3-amino-2,3-dideoxy-glucuronate N-acetyltransferase
MKRVRLAILGCGRWGSNLVRVFSQIPDCQVCVLCTRNNTDSMRALAAKYQTRWCPDPFSVWQDANIDAVVIATPDATHHALAKKAIEFGKHLFVEKPLALTAEECADLQILATSRHVTLQVGHILQYHPATAVIGKSITNKWWGALLHIEVNNLDLNDYPIGSELLTGTIVHDLSFLASLFEMKPQILFAQGVRFQAEGAPASVRAELRYGAVPVSIRCNMASPMVNRDVLLTFELALLRFERAGKGRLSVHAAAAPPGDLKCQTAFARSTKVSFPPDEPLLLECKDFIEAIRDERSPRVTGVTATRIAETLDQLRPYVSA